MGDKYGRVWWRQGCGGQDTLAGGGRSRSVTAGRGRAGNVMAGRGGENRNGWGGDEGGANVMLWSCVVLVSGEGLHLARPFVVSCLCVFYEVVVSVSVIINRYSFW